MTTLQNDILMTSSGQSSVEKTNKKQNTHSRTVASLPFTIKRNRLYSLPYMISGLLQKWQCCRQKCTAGQQRWQHNDKILQIYSCRCHNFKKKTLWVFITRPETTLGPWQKSFYFKVSLFWKVKSRVKDLIKADSTFWFCAGFYCLVAFV